MKIYKVLINDDNIEYYEKIVKAEYFKIERENVLVFYDNKKNTVEAFNSNYWKRVI